MYNYVIVGNGHMALPVKSDMTLFKFQDLIRSQSRKLHANSYDMVWSFGTVDFVNPEVLMENDFINRSPALIGIK